MHIVYCGSPDFALPPLEALISDADYQVVGVVSQPDRARGRGGKMLPTPVKAAAEAAGIPVITPRRINEPEAVAQIREWAPDVLVVVAFGQLLKQELLDLPPLGVVNVHASLLPKYRGAAPINRVVMEGESKTGVTTMFLDIGMDSGDMIIRDEIEIGPTDDAGVVHDKLAAAGAPLLIKTLQLIAKGEAPRTPQNHDEATFAPMLKKEDELIDWSWPAEKLGCHIRGMSPFPGTYSFYQGKRIKLFAPVVAAAAGQPGEILAADDKGLLIACGEGALLFGEVQPEGKARMAAAAFCRGYAPKAGTVLG